MLGPVLGGWLTDAYSWRWIFYINVPVGIVAILAIQRNIFDPPYIRRTGRGIDYWGIGLLVVGIGALQILLDKGQQEDWFQSDFMTALAVISVICLAIFVAHALLSKHPVVDLSVFRLRTYSAGVFLMTMLGFMLYGSLVMLPIWLQTLMGYPALEAGLTLAPRGLGGFIAMPIVGIILARLDARKVLVVGLVGASVTLLQLSALNLEAGYWNFFWPQFLQGMAMAMLFVPLTTTTMDPIPNHQMGNATSIFNLMRNIGGSIGIATSTTLVARNQQANINRLGAHVNAFDPQAQAMLEGIRNSLMAQGTDYASATRQAYGVAFGLIQRQAAVVAFLSIFRLMGVLFLVMLPLLLLMKRPATRRPGPAH
jgi:DHA2 family multidrug resistance protein